jgi:SCP-2 sterol transfer family
MCDLRVVTRLAATFHRGQMSEPPVIDTSKVDADELTIGGAHFLRLVTGNAAGPTLCRTGKLRIKRDMMFAASTASLFRIPNA